MSSLSHHGSRSGKVLGKLVLVLFAFVLLFETVPRFLRIPGLEPEALAPEYVTSESAKKFEPHPYLIMTPKPGAWGVGTASEKTHGASGFRGAEIPLAKPEGGLRIACLGGSSTYGTGPSKDAFTWPARLQTILSEELPDRPVDVLNGGVPSWNSFEALENLAFRVLPYAPDIVLIYLATNDAECAMWPDPTFDNRHYRMSWPTYRPSPIEPILEKSVLYLTWRKYATDYLSQRADLGFVSKVVPEGEVGAALRQLQVPPELRSPPDTGFINFQRNLVSILAIAQAHGAQPVLMTQAMYSKDPESDHLTHGRTRLAAQQRMTEIVRAVAQERGVPLVEIEPDLEAAAAKQVAETGQQTLFVDDVHLTDEGTAFVANRLAQELKRLGVL
ncbi:GDSL-like Lipase/Acylhydrolase [Planctomycetes bacterium Poly30]|uniref:GDSL-like Lipase/Acylhydrolase n=1 Tax=Saltatorellus ferox TaxID=2528018 RepID=A0A518EN08_9BACT|nr:GDSL-like Lipase/Acylhydrolase [Planctomycetes bacterium Poly30]